MELEDYVEKLQKQKKFEKKVRRAKEKDEKLESRDQIKQLMKYTSSQKWKVSPIGRMHMWKVFKERTKNYYKFPRGVVYLSHIPHGFFEEQMASYFSQFGKVTGIYMPRAPSGKIRGYAFIEFQLEVIAKIVVETMNNYLFYQRILKAKYIPPEQQKPYMFVNPFGDKRKTALKIEAERKLRGRTLSESEEKAYQQKIAKKLALVKNKMNALGSEFTIQVSGEAPPPPTQGPISEKKKLKQIKSELGSKSAVEDTKDIESLFDDKLTKQIQKNIARKLAKPLSLNKAKVDTEDSGSEEDDFETADENSFSATTEGFDYTDSDSDEETESPPKKLKQDKQVEVSATPNKVSPKVKKDNSPKSGKKQKTPTGTPQVKNINTDQDTPAQVKSGKKKSNAASSNEELVTPTGKTSGKDSKFTPQQSASKSAKKANKPSPLRLQTPSVEKPTSPKSLKKSAHKKLEKTKIESSSAKNLKKDSATAKSPGSSEKFGLKRKSMSDVKKSKLQSLEKKKKSLPK